MMAESALGREREGVCAVVIGLGSSVDVAMLRCRATSRPGPPEPHVAPTDGLYGVGRSAEARSRMLDTSRAMSEALAGAREILLALCRAEAARSRRTVARCPLRARSRLARCSRRLVGFSYQVTTG